MGDPKQATGGNGEGQSPLDITDVGQPVQPQYITRDEAQRMAEEAAETAFRRAQGLVDKRDARIRQVLESVETALNLQAQAGIVLTPEQKEQVKQHAVNSALQADYANANSSEDPAQDTNMDDIDPVTAIAIQLESDFGVEVDLSDPEAQMINREGTPTQYLDSYREALIAKSQRLQSSNIPQTNRTPGNLAASGQPAKERVFEDYREYLSSGLRR